MILNAEICERARISRDARFDGKFFIGVISTGIFCRPICPAPPAKKENVRYFPTAAAAIEAGFRPCLRCCPEAAPGSSAWNGSSSLLECALDLIHQGVLNDGTVEDLGERLGVSSRQLRRLFKQHLGATPINIARSHRALFAKKLLTETELTITDIAMASGFGSLRQFNSVFRDLFRMSPGDIRKGIKKSDSGKAVGRCTLYLAYRPPFDWEAMLAFMQPRLIPGVEYIESHKYQRTFRLDDYSYGWFEVSDCRDKNALKLSISSNNLDRLLMIQERVRQMFDLNADMEPIYDIFKQDQLLQPIVDAYPGIRLPGAWDGFEVAVRAILGQQISVKGATTLAGRIADSYGIECETGFPDKLKLYFPTCEELLGADLSGIGVTNKRVHTLQELTLAVCDGRISFDKGQELDDFVNNYITLPGIGPWTAHYTAMRALGHPDAFPDSDLGILKALMKNDKKATPREALKRAESWRPWRAYAAICLWKKLAHDAKGK